MSLENLKAKRKVKRLRKKKLMRKVILAIGFFLT